MYLYRQGLTRFCVHSWSTAAAKTTDYSRQVPCSPKPENNAKAKATGQTDYNRILESRIIDS